MEFGCDKIGSGPAGSELSVWLLLIAAMARVRVVECEDGEELKLSVVLK